jgi:hypothetical protein
MTKKELGLNPEREKEIEWLVYNAPADYSQKEMDKIMSKALEGENIQELDCLITNLEESLIRDGASEEEIKKGEEKIENLSEKELEKRVKEIKRGWFNSLFN